jgi:methyl-accepting chemotaxis protein
MKFFEILFGKKDQAARRAADEAGREVGSLASQLHDLCAGLSASTTEQASAIQETSASADEVNAMISRNAANAERSRTMSASSTEAAGRGKSAVAEMMKSIEEIHVSNREITREIEESNQKIAEIVKVIKDIGAKTKIINDIVFQTKLLSFNASVEAARAGEHGKGFAVVAEEVGNLARMSGNAAREISEILDSSITRVQNIVADTGTKVSGLMAESSAKIDRGTVTARRCGDVLDELVSSVNQMSSCVSEIANASREQAQGVNEINRAMSQLDALMQTNLSSTQSAAQLAHKLKAQSSRLAIYTDDRRGGSEPPRVSAPEAKVIPLPAAPKAVKTAKASSSSPAPQPAVPGEKVLKLASGATVPSRDDRRFEEV